MSDFDESELSQQSENVDIHSGLDRGPDEVIEDNPTKAAGYYKSKKGDADKRKQTSRANAEKARMAKLAKLAQTKKTMEYEQQYEYKDSTDDSSSEEELQITRKKPRKSKPSNKLNKTHNPIDDRFSKLEDMIAQLANTKTKEKKRVAKKTVIHTHVHQPTPVKSAAVPKKAFMIDLID